MRTRVACPTRGHHDEPVQEGRPRPPGGEVRAKGTYDLDIEADGDDPATAASVVAALYAKYKKNVRDTHPPDPDRTRPTARVTSAGPDDATRRLFSDGRARASRTRFKPTTSVSSPPSPPLAHSPRSSLAQKDRKADYPSLISFLVFVSFYLAILFLQRSAEEAYMLTSTIRSSVVPEATEMHNSAEVRAWIEGVVTQTWQDEVRRRSLRGAFRVSRVRSLSMQGGLQHSHGDGADHPDPDRHILQLLASEGFGLAHRPHAGRQVEPVPAGG